MEKGGIFLIRVTYKDLGSLYFSVLTDFQVGEVYEYIKKNERVKEAMVLWTCNRFEIYFSPGDRETVQYIEDFVEGKARRYSVVHGWDSVKHLFLVAAGLDSMVLGENEILSQVRESWKVSRKMAFSGPNLNRIMRKALEIGKKVRRENGRILPSRSVASEALDQLKFSEGEKALVIGAGKLGKQISAILSRKGVKFSICNRTEEKAKQLAAMYSSNFEKFDKRKWKSYDNLIFAIKGGEYALVGDDLINSRVKNVVDLGTPQNVPSKISKGVNLINMSSLSKIIESRESKKNEFATNSLKIVNDEFSRFSKKMMNIEKEELLRKIYEYSDRIIREEMKYMDTRANCRKDIETMEKGLQSIRNKLLGFVINGIKSTEDVRSSEIVGNMEMILNENISRYEAKKVKKIA